MSSDSYEARLVVFVTGEGKTQFLNNAPPGMRSSRSERSCSD